jgi:hypothetical protein
VGKMNKVVHILRYGTVAEKTHLERTINTYDSLIINGNSAAYVSRAIAKFVVERFLNKPEKGFIIDPITYAFQQNIELLKNKSKTGELVMKKSIVKLIGKYGSPIDKVNNDVPVKPSDFSNQKMMYEFCQNVLKFQYFIIDNYISNNELTKYLKYASGIFLEQFHPKLLIAPYFYLDPNDADFDNWLDLNIQFLNLSVEQVKNTFNGLPVFGHIVINKDVLLDESYIKKITKKYSQCDCTGINFWVDGFDEHEDNQNMLSGFIDFLHELKGKPVYNMYGGFFSILLTHNTLNLLSGVSHGMEYGENREVYPVGGGLPVSKYYYLPLHERKEFTQAFLFLEHQGILDRTLDDWGTTARYYSEICSCPKCSEIMENSMVNFAKFASTEDYEVKYKHNTIRRKKASAETKENCLHHYLLCKKLEFELIKKCKNIEDILIKLQEEKGKYIAYKNIKGKELQYIDNWCNCISDYLTDRRTKH